MEFTTDYVYNIDIASVLSLYSTAKQYFKRNQGRIQMLKSDEQLVHSSSINGLKVVTE